MLSADRINKIAKQVIPASALNIKELVEFCKLANKHYREGNPIISDSDYDFVFLAELVKRDPNNSFAQNVETEDWGEHKLLLPEPMLSTNKAYTFAEIQKFCQRLTKSAEEIVLNPLNIIIRVTPKLDGFAAFDDGRVLYTRGDGKKGNDISRAFNRGLRIFNNKSRGLGAGEIVIAKSYFNKYLKKDFEHPRNFTASIIKEKELADNVRQAIKAKAAVFVPFSALPSKKCDIKQLLSNFDNITNTVLTAVDFDVDGVVIEAINADLREHMGSNRKFHRYQIAFKENTKSSRVKIIKINPQVGRTGKITPVAILEPTLLSGATITHATCHHYGMVKKHDVGANSLVELVRSGQVIPKIVKVIKKTNATIPQHCLSCGTKLIWDNDFLMCPNNNCPERNIGSIEHFFKTLANNDGFGKKTITKLFNAGITKISSFYKLTTDNLISFGFGKKTANNLITELHRSREIQIEDYRFLSAFGVARLGLGNSENLLKHYKIEEVFNLSVAQVANIEGFATMTADSIVAGLKAVSSEFNILYGLGFNLEYSAAVTRHNIFADKHLVFSGAMNKPRPQMEKQAKQFGAVVQKGVSNKTDYLIIGDNVGQNKLKKAHALGITVLPEDDYIQKLVSA